jgi:hypothetical protein
VQPKTQNPMGKKGNKKMKPKFIFSISYSIKEKAMIRLPSKNHNSFQLPSNDYNNFWSPLDDHICIWLPSPNN